MPPRKPDSEIADYPAAAAMARDLLGVGPVTREAVIRSAFRDQYGLALRTAPELQEIALAIVAASREARMAGQS